MKCQKFCVCVCNCRIIGDGARNSTCDWIIALSSYLLCTDRKQLAGSGILDSKGKQYGDFIRTEMAQFCRHVILPSVVDGFAIRMFKIGEENIVDGNRACFGQYGRTG